VALSISQTMPSARQSKLTSLLSKPGIIRVIVCVPWPSFCGGSTRGRPRSHPPTRPRQAPEGEKGAALSPVQISGRCGDDRSPDSSVAWIEGFARGGAADKTSALRRGFVGVWRSGARMPSFTPLL